MGLLNSIIRNFSSDSIKIPNELALLIMIMSESTADEFVDNHSDIDINSINISGVKQKVALDLICFYIYVATLGLGRNSKTNSPLILNNLIEACSVKYSIKYFSTTNKNITSKYESIICARVKKYIELQSPESVVDDYIYKTLISVVLNPTKSFACKINLINQTSSFLGHIEEKYS